MECHEGINGKWGIALFVSKYLSLASNMAIHKNYIKNICELFDLI